MPPLKRPSELWQNKVAYLISKNRRQFMMEIRDLLQRRRWRILDESNNSDEDALAAADTGKISLFIVDDSLESPAFNFIRQALFHEVAVITPFLVLSSEHSLEDIELTASMSELETVVKPFSPDSFLKGFDALTKRWSSGYLQELRMVANKIVGGNRRAAMEKLALLFRQDASAPLVNAALSLQYRKLGKISMSEKVLFAAIQRGRMDMTVVLPLLESFIHNAKPEYAEKLALKVMKKFHDPTFLCVTLIQIYLMQNKVKETIPFLKQMVEKGYFPEVAKDYLPRVFYSCGMMEEFTEAIRQKSQKFDDYQKAWHVISPEDAARRRLQFEQMVRKRKAELREEAEAAKSRPKIKVPREKVLAPIGQPLLKD